MDLTVFGIHAISEVKYGQSGYQLMEDAVWPTVLYFRFLAERKFPDIHYVVEQSEGPLCERTPDGQLHHVPDTVRDLLFNARESWQEYVTNQDLTIREYEAGTQFSVTRSVTYLSNQGEWQVPLALALGFLCYESLKGNSSVIHVDRTLIFQFEQRHFYGLPDLTPLMSKTCYQIGRLAKQAGSTVDPLVDHLD